MGARREVSVIGRDTVNSEGDSEQKADAGKGMYEEVVKQS